MSVITDTIVKTGQQHAHDVALGDRQASGDRQDSCSLLQSYNRPLLLPTPNSQWH